MKPEDYLPPHRRRPRPVPPSRAWWDGAPLIVGAVSLGMTVFVLTQWRGAGFRIGVVAGIFVVTGLVSAIRPGWGFEYGSRWSFRERPEPSAAYLTLTRAGGMLVLTGGLVIGGVAMAHPTAFDGEALKAAGSGPQQAAAPPGTGRAGRSP